MILVHASAVDGEDLWIMIVVMLLLLMLFDGMLPAFANDVATRRQTARSKRCQLLPSFDPSSTIPPPSTHCISTSSLHVASRALPHSLQSLLSTVSFGATVRCSKNFASRQQSRALYSQPLSPSSHLRVYISQPPAQRRTPQTSPRRCEPWLHISRTCTAPPVLVVVTAALQQEDVRENCKTAGTRVPKPAR